MLGGMPPLDSIGFALRSAFRRLATRKAFAAGVILTLGIGLAAVTFMSAIAYGVLLRPLPYPASSQLVEITTTDAAGRPGGVSLPDVEDWRQQAVAFQELTAFIALDGSIETSSGTLPVRLAAVDREFFDLLGLPALRGRLLNQADEHAPAVVLSAKAWQRFSGRNDSVTGSSITVNGETATVVGVADPATALPDRDVDAWIPLEHARAAGPPQWSMRGFRGFRAVGRIRGESTIDAAAAALYASSARLASAYPRFNEGVRSSVRPLSRALTMRVRSALLFLWGGAVLLLLVTCGNAASLALTDALQRRQEIAVRVALGAARARIVLETMTETVLLSLAGCAAGVGTAALLVRWFQANHPERFPRLEAVRVDSPIVAVAVAAAIAAALIAAAAPATRAVRSIPADALKEVRPAGRSSRRAHRVLVLGQMAMAVMLLLGTLSVARQLSRALDADLGVTDTGVVAARVDLASAAYAAPDAQQRFMRLLLERLTVQGAAAGVVSSVPPATGQMRTTMKPTGADTSSPDVLVDIVAATPGALELMGVRLLRGRTIADSDTHDSAPVAVISDTAARRLFPGRDPIGLRAPFGSTPGQPVVVGIVGDVRYRGLDAVEDAAMYLPASQRSFRTMYVVVRGRASQQALTAQVTTAVRGVDPSAALGPPRTLAALRRDAASGYAFRATIIGTLTMAALVLTTIGVHGVTSQSVAVRAREFAVRAALGSPRDQLLRLVLTETAWLCGVGAVLGVLLTIVGQRLARGALAGLTDLDGVTVTVACATVVLLGVGVALRPTWRAASTNPASALR